MDPRDVKALLRAVRDGGVTPEDAAERLKSLPYEDLGFAKVDHHRALRRGFPEVVFGAGKTPEQIVAIAEKIAGRGQNLLITRTVSAVHVLLAARHPTARWHDAARSVSIVISPPPALPGRVAVVCAALAVLAPVLLYVKTVLQPSPWTVIAAAAVFAPAYAIASWRHVLEAPTRAALLATLARWRGVVPAPLPQEPA